MSNLIKNLIPEKKEDKCGYTILVDCGVEPTSASANIETYSIIFPSEAEETVPLLGGAIIRFDLSSLNNATNDDVILFLKKYYSNIESAEFSEGISGLVKGRLLINSSLSSIASSPLLDGRPSIYMATSTGDEVPSKDSLDPNVKKICQFKFIPIELIQQISQVFENKILEKTFPGLNGISGRSLGDYKLINSEDDITAAIMEYFPIINLDSDEIESRSSDFVFGGYFTIFNNNAYLKSANLSGLDSAKFGHNIYSDDIKRKMYFEVVNGVSVSRITMDYLAPPIVRLKEYDGIFPESNDLDVFIESDTEVSRAYLSLVVPTSIDRPKSLKTFSDGIELFTAPNINHSVFPKEGDDSSGDESGIDIYEESYPIDTFINYINDIVEADVIKDRKRYGIPFTDKSITVSHLLGEKNRPEIMLSERTGDGASSSNRKNDKRYRNSKMNQAREIMASVRPNIVTIQQTPWTWVDGGVEKTDDGYKLLFNFDDFSKINREYFVSNGITDINFSLYVSDSLNQLIRVPGPNLILGPEIPIINEIEPNGLADSSSIEANSQILIRGENFTNVTYINIESASGEVSFQLPTDDPWMSFNATNDLITFAITDVGIALFTESNSIYYVSVGTKYGGVSPPKSIYIGDQTTAPLTAASRASFLIGEMQALDFSSSVYGIPILLNGDSASIGLKSKSKLFSGDFELYAYLGFDSSDSYIINDFDYSEDSTTITGASPTGGDIMIPSSIEFEFGLTPDFDFYRVSNKKAKLKFPGKYSGRNFSKLYTIDKAYIIILSQKLSTLTSDKIADNEYSLIQLGKDSSEDSESIPAFIQPALIKGIVADLGDGNGISINSDVSENAIIKDTYGKVIVGSIDAYKKIPKLSIVFYGNKIPLINKRYNFYLGTEKINNKLDGKIKISDNGREAVATFKNISTKQEGILDIYVEKEDKVFDITYNSNSVIGAITAIAYKDDFSIDEETGALILSSDIGLPWSEIPTNPLISGFINGSSPGGTLSSAIETLLPQTTYGILPVNPATQDKMTFRNSVSASPTQGDFTIKIIDDNSESNDVDINRLSSEDAFGIYKDKLVINSGSEFLVEEFVFDDLTYALIFNKLKISSPVTITVNHPRIVTMGKSRKGLNNEKDITKETVIPVVAGEKLYFRLKNVGKNFIIKIGETTIVPSSIDKVKGKIRTVDITVSIPTDLSVKVGDCFVICASSTNSERLRAKNMLGRDLVVNSDEILSGIFDGKLANKIPDIDELKDILLNAPLRFLQLELNDSSAIADSVKSFCDLSFHLLADLKLALNGFQVLMIPIQVIFCIIDVLCSLLNPIKVAKALIRLFECLYDLVLLLPQISVPVMFLQLLLHLLKLLECLFDKVFETIYAINATIGGIATAISSKSWNSVLALEEILSKYFLTLNIDLDLLSPVISILSVFLQLLQLVFRFPCRVSPGDGDPACGLDGTLLAGIVAGVVAPEEQILFDKLIPVAQSYTEDSVEDAIAAGASTFEDPVAGDIVASKADDETYLEDMDMDEDTLRATESGLGFLVSMATSATKSRKGFKNPASVKFEFRGRGTPGTFFKKKIIDPSQSADTPIKLLAKNGDSILEIASGKGNFISPIDGETFITKSGDYGTVEPLTLTFEIPIYELNEDTGEVAQTGVEKVTRTFDEIPKMAILDEQFNLYFIDEEGIEFDSNDEIVNINARMINNVSAPKLKLSNESVEIDTDDPPDGVTDDEANVFDFPQLYFVDIRECHEQIQKACYNSSLNSFLLEEDNSDDVEDIINDSKTCLEEFISTIRGVSSDGLLSLQNGEVPALINVTKIEDAFATLQECLGGGIDDICRYVINPLNTSFKVLEDDNETPLSDYVIPELNEDDLEGFETNPANITGAEEYANGIGDSATVRTGDNATISITPRDAMDIVIGGDISDNIKLTIVSDTTGAAEIISDNNEKIFTKQGEAYIAYITSSNSGEVRLRASVCDRTIQAVTYAENVVSQLESEVDCIPDVSSSSSNTNTLGALTKVDRIISIFFINGAISTISTVAGSSAITSPQAFGTSLEN